MAARPVRHVEAQREHPEIDELSPARAQRGDRAAQTALVERYQRPVFALLSRMVGRERAEVGDLAQETFLRALRALSRFSVYGPARLSTWLMTFATRLAVDHLRRTTPRVDEVTAAGGLPGALPWPDQDAQCRALAVALTEAVETLGPQLRAAFLLREVHGLAYDEIARTLEIEAGTATSRLARARAALQEALAGMHAENSVDEKSLIDDLWPALEPPGDFSARVVGALDGTASSAVPARRPRRALGVLAAVGVAAMVSVRWGPTGSAARDRWRARPRASRPRAEGRCIGGWRWLSPARSWSGRAAPQACVSSSGAARLSTASRRAPRSWWRRAWVSPCHWHPLPGRPRQGGLGQRLRGLGLGVERRRQPGPGGRRERAPRAWTGALARARRSAGRRAFASRSGAAARAGVREARQQAGEAPGASPVASSSTSPARGGRRGATSVARARGTSSDMARPIWAAASGSTSASAPPWRRSWKTSATSSSRSCARSMSRSWAIAGWPPGCRRSRSWTRSPPRHAQARMKRPASGGCARSGPAGPRRPVTPVAPRSSASGASCPARPEQFIARLSEVVGPDRVRGTVHDSVLLKGPCGRFETP